MCRPEETDKKEHTGPGTIRKDLKIENLAVYFESYENMSQKLSERVGRNTIDFNKYIFHKFRFLIMELWMKAMEKMKRLKN